MRRNSIFIFFIILISCKNADYKNLDKGLLDLQKELTYTQQPNGYCLFISFEGCSSCRSKAIAFLENNYTHKAIVYILSAKQKRIIQFSVNKQTLTKENVLVDTKYVAHSLGLISDFPTLYHIKEGKIQEVKILTATNIDEELHLLEIKLKNSLP
jgi:hypothetical protein